MNQLDIKIQTLYRQIGIKTLYRRTNAPDIFWDKLSSLIDQLEEEQLKEYLRDGTSISDNSKTKINHLKTLARTK